MTPRSVLSFATRQRVNAGIIAGALGAAILVYLVYSRLVGPTNSGLMLSPFFGAIHAGYNQFGMIWKQAVGNFGWVLIPLPSALYTTYLIFLLALILLAALFARARERLVLGACLIITVAFPILLYAFALRPPMDWGVQGRYVLPLMVLLPLTAGHLMSRAALRLPQKLERGLAAVATACISVFGLVALWHNAKANTGIAGAFPFFSPGAWSPPVGWPAWFVLATGALVALAIVAIEPLRTAPERDANY